MSTELEAKLHSAPVGFAVVEGPEMTFTQANARYLEMVSRSDIVGRRWVDVFPELVGTPTHDAVSKASEGAPFHVEEFAIPLVRDGVQRESFYTFNLDPTRDRDGRVNGFVCIAVEVTELVVRRREAEALAARLRASEARYRAVFEAVDDGFCLMQLIFDGEGKPTDYRFLEANEAFMRHTGLKDPIGKTARELVPDLDESWFRLYGAVAMTGQATQFENNAPAMGRWFEVFATRVGEPELRQVGLVFKDVSARKRAEQEREALLENEQATRREAETANRLKDEFLATVSHELRTPLNSMLGWVLLLRSGRLAPERTGQALETVERNARAQAQLIEDLLDVSRILEGKLRLEVEPLDAQEVVEQAIETVRPAANAKGVRLQPTLKSGCTVMGDPHRLQQVVWNLLSNAVKFTPKGGRVQIVLAQQGSSVEITVADTGIGITKEFQPHVFERFRQADAGATRKHGGLGLGLSIARNLIEMHGGTVSVFSEGEGKGATFTVTLPLALARRSERSTPPPSFSIFDAGTFGDSPALVGVDVLAVDDEGDSREMMRALLESRGANVRVAGSAAEAFAMFQEASPSVLVSDIGMPGEDGFALIRKIRELPEGRDTPAVALTAYARTEDRTHCLLAGFSSHVPKPVEPMELFAVIASLAGRNRPPPRA
jgi:PAS domain S-box-containing protein